MSVEGWVFDLYPRSPNSMIVWLKTVDGGHARLVDTWKPSFFVAGQKTDLDSLSKRLRAESQNEEWFERVDSSSKSPMLRVFYENSRECEWLKNYVLRLSRDGERYRLYNLDVPLDQLYMYEKDIFPLAHVKADQANGRVDWNLVDSAYDTDYSLPSLRQIELGVETNGHSFLPTFHDTIKSVNLKVGDEVFSVDSGDERAKLVWLVKQVHSLDPDIVVTRDGDGFLLPYLSRRAQVNNVSYDFSLGREEGQRLPERREGQSYFSYGRVYYRHGSVRLLGRLHVDQENTFIYADCGLEGLFEVSRCCRISAHRASRSTIGTAMTSLQMYTATRLGFLIPWRKEVPEDFKTAGELLVADRGGFIYEPQVGLHENVGELDYSSLYPMLMYKKNLSPETVNCVCCPESPDRVPELDYHICKKKGIVPESLDILLKKRQVYKHLSKNGPTQLRDKYRGRSDALKWILVCCLPPDSPVLVSRDGKIEYSRIGEVVNSHVGDNFGILDCPSELFVAGIGHDLKSRFCRVGKLIKVPSPAKLLKITLDDGRQVRCTADHPFYILKDGRLCTVKAEELAQADFIPVAKQVKEASVSTLQLSLFDAMEAGLSYSEKDLWRVKSEDLKDQVNSSAETLMLVRKEEEKNIQLINVWRKNGIVPFKYLRHFAFSHDPPSKLFIGRGRRAGGRVSWLPASLSVDEDLGFLLGFYVADGSASRNFIRLDVGGNETEIIQHLCAIMERKFGLTPRIYKEKKANMYVVQINSSSLVQIFQRVFELPGSADRGKLKVPNLVFNASKETILGFLSGLIAGDGTMNKDRHFVSIATCSYDFAVQIGYLALRAGIAFNILKGERLHSVYFIGPNGIGHFEKCFMKKAHRTRFLSPKNACAIDCNHAVYEMFPVVGTGLDRAARVARTVRTPRLEGRIRICPERASESLQRIQRSPRFRFRLSQTDAKLKQFLEADIGFVKVKEIEEVESDSPYVYCFQLAEGEFPAFFTGSGGVLVHNCFGYLGFKNARFGKIDAHISVCAFARDILLRTSRFAEAEGFELLHGIVDSVWLKRDDAKPEDYQKLAMDLGKNLDLPLSFEGVYRWVMFLPSKVHLGRPVLNRYYGIFSDDKLKVRGVAIRRHDTPPIVKKLQEDILFTLGKASNIHEFQNLLPDAFHVLEKHVERVRSGSVEAADLVVRKNLSQNPSQYSHKVLQAVAAQQLSERGVSVEAGQTVGYIILDNDSSMHRKRVVARELAEDSVSYDASAYSSLLIAGASELLSPFGWDKQRLASLL